MDVPHDISATVYLKQKNQSVFDLIMSHEQQFL